MFTAIQGYDRWKRWWSGALRHFYVATLLGALFCSFIERHTKQTQLNELITIALIYTSEQSDSIVHTWFSPREQHLRIKNCLRRPRSTSNSFSDRSGHAAPTFHWSRVPCVSHVCMRVGNGRPVNACWWYLHVACGVMPNAYMNYLKWSWPVFVDNRIARPICRYRRVVILKWQDSQVYHVLWMFSKSIHKLTHKMKPK